LNNINTGTQRLKETTMNSERLTDRHFLNHRFFYFISATPLTLS